MKRVSAPAKQPTYPKSKAIFFVIDPKLQAVYRETLVRAGFEVQCVTTGCKALELIGSIPFDLFIAGFRVPEQDRNEVASHFKKRNAKGRVVFLYSGSIRNAEIADVVISVQSGPAELALVIGEQLPRAETSVGR